MRNGTMANLPRTYRADPRIRHTLLGIGWTPFALAVVTSILRYLGLMNRRFSTGDFIAIAATGAFGTWFLFILSQRVLLYEDAIEKITWFSTRKLNRENILGWKGRSYRGYSYIFVPRDGSRTLTFSPIFRWDREFFEWKKSIPHLKD